MGSVTPKFKLIDHTADLGISVVGNDMADLFENASVALMQIMVKTSHTDESRKMKVTVLGMDLPDLMVRWLSEILYLLQGENRVVNQAKILEIDSEHLVAELDTTFFSAKQHEIINEIKAITYHRISVSRQKGRWQAQVIFDL